MFFGPSFIILIPALIISLYAQYKVKSTFNKYHEEYSNKGISGSEVARKLLQENGLDNVAVKQVDGKLSDHYDPKEKVLNLSGDVYSSNSLAAIGVAAHETGHAIQDAKGYNPMKIRAALVPAANLGSNFGLPLAVMGFIFWDALMYVGLIVFLAAVLFHMITLPVEFNASNRALTALKQGNYLSDEELQGSKKVLRAAAFTYVAATIVAIANLLRILIMIGLGQDD